ncbi:MAG: 23S rRNA (pseudouridine(1915)-N(3))-methyltransferase RlmH [Bdellovibrionota bacterium]
MKILLLIPETKKQAWLEDFIQEYQKKIKPYCEYEKKSIKPGNKGREEASLRKKEEAKSFLNEIKSDDYVIALDEKGSSFTSVEFASKLQKIKDQSPKRIVFVMGGPYGLSEEILERAQMKVSLSKMTMNHLVVQVFFLEQLYRAFTIMNRIPYHNE